MSTPPRPHRWLAALVSGILAQALVACSTPGFDDVQLSELGEPPAGVDVSSSAVSLPLGAVVEVSATPMSASGPLGGSFTFDLVSSDPNVLGVEAALGQPAGAPVFVFFGASAGTTQIEIVLNGMMNGTLAAKVTAPL